MFARYNENFREEITKIRGYVTDVLYKALKENVCGWTHPYMHLHTKSHEEYCKTNPNTITFVIVFEKAT